MSTRPGPGDSPSRTRGDPDAARAPLTPQRHVRTETVFRLFAGRGDPLMARTGNMLPVDFDASNLQIEGCESCGPAWWAEVVVYDGMVLVREWHRESCPDWGDAWQAPEVDAAPLTDGVVVVHGAGLAGLTVVAVGASSDRTGDAS